MSTTNTGANLRRSCVAGLFRDDERAQRAAEQLKTAGFASSEIGIATTGETSDSHSEFWDKVDDVLGKRESSMLGEDLRASLVACGMDEPRARYLDDALSEGAVLITVSCDSARGAKAEEILRAAGADIGDTAARANVTEMPRREARRTAATNRKIQLRGEVLQVEKERIPAGEVRLHKEVVTEPQHLEVPVKKEHIVVERTAGTGAPASGPVGAENQEIRIPVSEEHVKVEKKPVVEGEVSVRSETTGETKPVEAELKHEELRSERSGDVEVRGDKGEIGEKRSDIDERAA